MNPEPAVALNRELAFQAGTEVQAKYVPGGFWNLAVAPQPDPPGTWLVLLTPHPAYTVQRDPLWLATGSNEQTVRAVARQWRTSANDLAMCERIRDTPRPQPTLRATFRPLRLAAGNTNSPISPDPAVGPKLTRGAHR
ncbi:hypothetical protein [Actinoplanes regularis]|uniref:hypothetical protein n=1 Tax=Actinoplanes regularis TaxID=52697 RepID=UPI0024A38C18|nr:hypothetical protein [Actinoplanes regularis]GLW34461.1 hypothetical protein Areg01_73980 [Actinoplanes regularis]